MKRQMLPRVEALETKALLSHLGVGTAARNHHIAQVVKHTSQRVLSELTISLTTNQSSYTVGQNVQMSLTATNDTRHNVTVWVGPKTNAFSITQNGQTIWRSDSGPQPLSPTVRRVLHPGQTLTLTANWTATSAGTFVVHNQMVPRGPVATFSVMAIQPIPPVSPPTIPPANPPVSPPVGSELAISLTTNQSSYTVGQIVQMTLTATDDTDGDVTVWVGPNTNVFSITQNGQTIWKSNSAPQPLNPTVAEVLSPGQSLTLTANWTAMVTGAFVVHNQIAPQGPVATFSVAASLPVPPVSPPVPPVSPPVPPVNPPVPPVSPPVPPVSPPVPPVSPPVGSELAITLTTNQSSYTVGQLVQMTLTATNDSNHDVTIWVGPNTNVFTITQNGQIVWRSNSGPPSLRPTVAKVLHPGDSLTLAADWTATETGTFVVSNQIDPQGPVATFSVVSSQPTSGV